MSDLRSREKRKKRRLQYSISGIVTFLLILLLITVCVICFGSVQLEDNLVTPFATNGKLSVKGMYLVNKDGVPFIMQGVSTMNIGSHKQFITREAFQIARDQWHVNTVRLPVATMTWDGYYYRDNRKDILQTLDEGITLADELGLYVIINWGMLQEGNPLYTKKLAVEFFTYVADKYADHDNLIYEICNEPNGSRVSWKHIKTYANYIIPLIRSFDSDAVIVVGTPDFSHTLESVIDDPLTEDNILYSYHFYAGTHGSNRREELKRCLEKSIPVLVSEFSISTVDSDGSDSPQEEEGEKWISLLDQYQVGRIFFSLSNAEQTNAMLKKDCGTMKEWSEEYLTETGQWIIRMYLDDARSYLKD